MPTCCCARGSRPPALRVLAEQVPSDAVLLRRAYAYKLSNDARWRELATEAAERFAALDARGEALAPHARERALAALWIQEQPALAWRAAQANFGLQKEPLDWWISLQSAERAGQADSLAKLREELAATGLRDARLARWQTAVSAR